MIHGSLNNYNLVGKLIVGSNATTIDTVLSAYDSPLVQYANNPIASNIGFDNTTSGLVSTDVQSAIDTVVSSVTSNTTAIASLSYPPHHFRTLTTAFSLVGTTAGAFAKLASVELTGLTPGATYMVTVTGDWRMSVGTGYGICIWPPNSAGTAYQPQQAGISNIQFLGATTVTSAFVFQYKITVSGTITAPWIQNYNNGQTLSINAASCSAIRVG